MGIALFLTNVGNRDLGKNNVPLFDYSEENKEKSEKLRKYCEEIYKKITGNELKYKNIYEFTKELYSSGVYRKLDLEPIIIKPKIEKILEFHESLDVVLFGTLQNKRHKYDAFFTACIIEYLLKKEFGDKIRNIRVCAITNNPSDYAEMFDYYNKVLESFNDYGYESIYLGVTGGTPELAFGLITNGVIKWESNAKILYKSPYKKEVDEVEIGNRIFKILKEREFKILKERKIYGLASEIGKRYNLIKAWEVHYLKGLHYKELFDFKRALEEFKKAEENASLKYKKIIKNEIKLLSDLDRDDINSLSIKENLNLYVKLIKLLAENSKTKWEKGEYVDFVSRIFRMREAVLRFIIEKEFGISTNMKRINGEPRFPEFEKFLDENKDLVEYLKSKKWNGEKKPNVKVLMWILDYYINEVKDGKIRGEFNKKYANNKIGNIYEIMGKLEKLSELRNQSLPGHGFKGISKEDIILNYNDDKNNEYEIIEDLEKIVNALDKVIQ